MSLLPTRRPQPGPEPAQHLPAPGAPIWMPDELPPLGQIRTDGTVYAIYLPIGLRDWAPWRIITADHRALPPVTFRVVYGPEWTVLPTVVEIVGLLTRSAAPTPVPPANTQPASANDPAKRPRTFHPGDPCPPDLRGVITSDGQIWPASDWDHGVLATWEELLALHQELVEIPTAALLARAAASPVTTR